MCSRPVRGVPRVAPPIARLSLTCTRDPNAGRFLSITMSPSDAVGSSKPRRYILWSDRARCGSQSVCFRGEHAAIIGTVWALALVIDWLVSHLGKPVSAAQNRRSERCFPHARHSAFHYAFRGRSTRTDTDRWCTTPGRLAREVWEPCTFLARHRVLGSSRCPGVVVRGAHFGGTAGEHDVFAPDSGHGRRSGRGRSLEV